MGRLLKLITRGLQVLAGLFVGDGCLALVLAGWIGVFALASPRVPIGQRWGAFTLTAGCCLAFVVSVVRSARQNHVAVRREGTPVSDPKLKGSFENERIG